MKLNRINLFRGAACKLCSPFGLSSLARVVDVVSANWYNTNSYTQYQNAKVLRGIHVLNAHKPDREPDQPFVHGALINIKDEKTLGNTRRLIRLLKSLKYDSDGLITISSFDVEALIYQMPDAELQKARGQEIPLATACWLWLKKIEDNQTLRDSLDVPDAKRKIFTEGKATLQQLISLRSALERLLYEIEQGLKRSLRKLSDARIKWDERPF